eukprot:COSAG06_NODE_2361_length_7004_cov_49.479218_5_plen_388_part_00
MLLANHPVASPERPLEFEAAAAVAQEKEMKQEQEMRMRDAAEEGDAAAVRACLEAGADPNAPDPEWNGATAMHCAAAGGKSVEVLEVLHGAGAEVDKTAEDGVTPLMVAAVNSASGAVVRWLLEQGADWRLQATSGDYAGETALGIAKRRSQVEAASVLAAWVSEHGSAEEAAAAAAVVQELKQQEQVERMGVAAAGEGDAAEVRACLEAGADPNAPDPENYGRTAMHRAAVEGQSVEVLEVLRGAGAEVDTADRNGYTPLMDAAAGGATGAVVRWLLEQGADWRLQVPSGPLAGQTALGFARMWGKAEVTEAASVLAAWVSEHGSAEEAAAAAAVVQELKRREQEKRMRNAAKEGDAAGVRACLEAGADPTLRGNRLTVCQMDADA